MTQTPFVGAPQGAVWGFDPTTSLWIPVGISPKLIAANGEEYASLMVNVSNANTNGQALSSASAPVVISADQPPVSTYQSYRAWVSLFSAQGLTNVAWPGTGNLNTSIYGEMLINVYIHSMTGTSVQFKYARVDVWGNLLNIWVPGAVTTAPGFNFTTIGPGLSTNHTLGPLGELIMVPTALTAVNFDVDIMVR